MRRLYAILLLALFAACTTEQAVPNPNVDATAEIGPLAVIGAGARVGPRTRIAAHATIGAGVDIGAIIDECRALDPALGPAATWRVDARAKGPAYAVSTSEQRERMVEATRNQALDRTPGAATFGR